MDEMTDDPLGVMAPVLHDLNVREVAASRLLAQVAAERDDLRREMARREAELDQREASAHAAIAECKEGRDQAVLLARRLGCMTMPKAAPKAAPLMPKVAATGPAGPTKSEQRVGRKRGRPRKERDDPYENHDPGGPPAFGVQRDAPPPVDDELRGEEDL